MYDCDAEDQAGKERSTKQRHWTLVIGIPSVDRPASLERRQRQRETWFKYSSVHSSILPRYLLGLHPSHEYKMSNALKEEIGASGGKSSDIIVFDLKEGKPATGKTVGGGGYWGLESEVGMSRKAYFWYCHAAANYVNADFIAKADDDLFLRANLVASILQGIVNEKLLVVNPSSSSSSSSSPSSSSFCASHGRLYWGRAMKWGAKKGDPGSKFPFVGGMFILMSRPLVQWIAASPIAAVNSQPEFHGDRLRYKQTNHDHEDVMVGRWLYDARLPVCVLSDPRFHDVHVGANLGKVRSNSIGMHHLTVDEYSQFMSKFDDKQGEDSEHLVDDAMKKLRFAFKDNDTASLWHGYAKMIAM